MRKSIKIILTILLLLVTWQTSKAQITGTVVDARTREPLPYVNVYYDKKGVGAQSDEKGRFSIKEHPEWKEVTVSSMGYVSQVIKIRPGKKNITIKLVPSPRQITDIVITASKTKYTRKGNPAVELMKKVIAHKKKNDPRSRDYFRYNSYEKLVCSVNNVEGGDFESEKMKKFAFMKDQIQKCEETGKMILPLTMTERVTEHYHRLHPKADKSVVQGERKSGMTTLFQTGEIFDKALEDMFTEVNIFENTCRLFKLPFPSPIADNAITFYRYYIQDTTYIDNDRVIQLSFIPNNQQDFGFTGHLYVMDDSTYQIRRVNLRIPGRSDINFVESLNITQDYAVLPSGDRVITVNDMLVEMQLAEFFSTGVLIQRTVRNRDFLLDSIPALTLSKIKGPTFTEPDAFSKTNDYWNRMRGTELSQTEKNMDGFMDNLKKVKGFKPVLFVLKTFMENFIETGDSVNNKVDIGPINTIVSYNHFDGLRLRASALTNANLCPHLFTKGYLAYGTQSRHFYGKGSLIYSFNKKSYLPEEFPMHDISLTYMNDILSPSDQFLNADKDNMFLAVKSSKNDQYNHLKRWNLKYTHEYENGLSYRTELTYTNDKPVDKLFYQPLDGKATPTDDPSMWLDHIITSEVTASVSYEPGAKYANTKQHRIKMNKEAPIFTLTHTAGIKGLLGSDYQSNVTELNIYKRTWLPHAWGRLDINFRAGAQWNKVPFPMLLMPPSNQSFVIQRNTFEMLNSMEFLHDRYALMFIDWQLNGKLFNRIPLLQKLKWREFVGFNIMTASLTDKNNPASSGYTDKDLFYFPGHFKSDGTFESNIYNMTSDRPYMELRFGITNIFKLLHVEAVRRLTYLDNNDVRKWGFRFVIMMQF